MPTKAQREKALIEQLPNTLAARIVRFCVGELKLSVMEAHDATRDASIVLSSVLTLRDGA